MTLPESFWWFASGRENPNACWMWMGFRDRDGYGRWRQGLAHRAAFLSVHEAIPVGLQIDHLCRTRACVNPAHLEAVTHRENMLRSIAVTGRIGRLTLRAVA